MPSILITGFEPFGGQKKNASWEAVRLLPDVICGCQVRKLLAPVVFGKAGQAVKAAVDELHPDYVFMTGEAGGRAKVTPETTAVNERVGRIPDNAGYIPEAGEKVIADGPERLHAALPMAEIVEALADRSLPITVSEDAGRFVCNDLFYTMLYAARDTGMTVDFVHVPYCEGQSKEKPFLPSEKAADALRQYMEAVIQKTVG